MLETRLISFESNPKKIVVFCLYFILYLGWFMKNQPYGAKKIGFKKILGPKEFWLQHFFPGIICVQKVLGKKVVKQIFESKFFASKVIFGSKQDLGLKCSALEVFGYK